MSVTVLPVHLEGQCSTPQVTICQAPYNVDLFKSQQTPMLRTFCANGAASASLNLPTVSAKPLITLTDPFTPRACKIIRNALQSSFSQSENVYNQSGPNAAVLIPLCNVNGQSGILLQVRGKLRTHPGEIRCVHDPQKSLFLLPENQCNEPVSLVVESMRSVRGPARLSNSDWYSRQISHLLAHN